MTTGYVSQRCKGRGRRVDADMLEVRGADRDPPSWSLRWQTMPALNPRCKGVHTGEASSPISEVLFILKSTPGIAALPIPRLCERVRSDL
jgi:hypothetical protein